MESTRIDWVREHCRRLRAISAEFTRTRPFDGLTIGTGIHAWNPPCSGTLATSTGDCAREVVGDRPVADSYQ